MNSPMLAEPRFLHGAGIMPNIRGILAPVFVVLLLTTAADAQENDVLTIPPQYPQLVEDVNCSANTRFNYHLVSLPTIEEIKALGELWPSIPPDENAAFMYARAFAWLTYPEEAPPGSASYPSDRYDGNIAPLRAYVEEQKNALIAARIAVSKHACSFPPLVIASDQRKERLSLPLAQFRQLSRTIHDAGFVAEVEGRLEEAASYYLACIRIGKHLQGGIFIESMTGEAIQHIGVFPLESLVAQGQLSNETLTHIARVCEESETSADDFANGCRKEALWITNPLIEKYWETMKEASARYGMAYPHSFEDYVADEKRLHDRLADVANVPPHVALREDYELESKLTGDSHWKYLKARAVLGKQLIENTARANTLLRGLQLLTAIERYKNEQGHAPDSLADLEPRFLEEPVLDPFSGEAFKYIRTEDGWTLWSIGPNLTDDGGDDKNPEDQSRIGKNDIVFRSQVPSNIDLRSRGGKE